MEKRAITLAIFVLGCLLLVFAFGIGWADWWSLTNRTVVMQALMGALVIVAFLLAVMAMLSKGKDRWKALTMDSVMMLGFSALVLFSIGWMAAPVAVILLVFSLRRLIGSDKSVA